MANVTPFQESDVLTHEFICQETDSRSSEVTVATRCEPAASPQDEDVSMSESNVIPEVPGRHRITTCKDVGFFATASTTHEAILSGCCDSHSSSASGSTEGDCAAAGTEHQSSSHLLPLKNAARVSDLFRSGTEGDTRKGQITALEHRESGISLSESLLLSVDLTSADLGTICDVNDKNYYRQMVLRSLLNAEDTDQGDSETRADAEDEAALNEDKTVGEGVENVESENVVSSFVEDSTCYDVAQVCVKSEERTGKFQVVQLDSSSQDMFQDAAGYNARNSGESLPAASPVDATYISVVEVTTTGVPDEALHAVSDGGSEERNAESLSDMLPVTDSKNISDSVSDIDMNLDISVDSPTPSLEDSKVLALAGKERAAVETSGRLYRSRSDTTVGRLEKADRSFRSKSVVLLEALFRAGAENSLTTAVRAGFCFTAVFVLLYAPSTIVNILTLYLQLLVCAIFVDIFLN